MENILFSGAEAIIIEDGNFIKKRRVQKNYRHPDLDKKIIKKRTKTEIKILKKAKEFIYVPEVKSQKKENEIILEKISGDKISDTLDSYPLKQQQQIMFLIGQSTAKIHKEGIIHGDLTTSNMILVPSTKYEVQSTKYQVRSTKYEVLNTKYSVLSTKCQVYFIDFGLSYLNGKYEDKAVDIHLLKEAIKAKHFKNEKILFLNFEQGYNSIDEIEAKKVFSRLNIVEKRGRYKN